MNLIVAIPDEMAARLAAEGGDLSRQALEALMLEALRAGRVTKGDLGRALGFEALDQLDGFLKAHGVFEPCTVEELDREVRMLERLGF